MRARNTPLVILFLLLAGAAALAPGCSSDSPSEPSQPPGMPPGTPPPAAAFNITVTVTPSVLEAGGEESATIRVEVRRTDNGQPPPNGTTVVVTTSIGSLGTPGGPQSEVLELINGVATILFFPPADPGTAIIQAQLQGSVGQAQVQIAEADALFISFVNPPVGSPQGGEQVVVQGSGFETPVRVTFGGANAQVLSTSPNQIRVVTPPSPSPGNQQAVVDVTVTVNVNEEEEASDTLVGGFTFSPGGGNPSVPAVLSVTPQSGPNEGGTLVVINGEGFVGPVQVIFGQGGSPDNFDGQEAQIQNVTSNRIDVLSPAALGFGQDNRDQLVSILVRNLGSGLATIEPSTFQYGTPVLITSFGPQAVPFFGGVPVTIFGQGFDNPVAVTLGGIAQPPTSVSGTEVVVTTQPIVTTSCADVTGPVSVTNIETGGGATAAGQFTYRVVAFSPEIVDVDPNSGPQAGNTLVTITGVNLLNPRVEFGGRPAAVVSVSPDGTSMSVRTPFLPDESLPTEACDDNQDGTNGERFLPTAVDVTVINRDTTCEDTFPDAFEYNPSDTSCRNDVGPPPPPPPP